jgi:hypothetical protein
MRPEDMSDDTREADEAQPEERAEDDGDEDDVEAHSRPLPPPRPMNSL